ncbi:MAG: hypothetical protein VYD64_11845 [Pseudomonadota bacterium]|nr:hypothetical protein [Pseudomonadota bacterium]
MSGMVQAYPVRDAKVAEASVAFIDLAGFSAIADVFGDLHCRYVNLLNQSMSPDPSSTD